MSERAHIQVKQPEYGKCRITGHLRDAIARYLYCQEVNLLEKDDQWEIEISPTVEEIAKSLVADAQHGDLDPFIPKEMQGQGYSRSLGNLLAEGLEAATANGYDYIIIDWF